MLKAALGKEIIIRAQDRVGALADIAKAVAEKGIGILAVNGWVEGEEAVIRLVTDDNLRASDALRQHGWSPREDKVVLARLAHKPGILRHMTEVLRAAGISLHHLYASADSDVGQCLVVFACSDNDRAIVEMDKAR